MHCTTASRPFMEEGTRASQAFADLLGFDRYCQGDGLKPGQSIMRLPAQHDFDAMCVEHHVAGHEPRSKGRVYYGDCADTAADIAAKWSTRYLVCYGITDAGAFYVLVLGQ